jgi:hypothetical protein
VFPVKGLSPGFTHSLEIHPPDRVDGVGKSRWVTRIDTEPETDLGHEPAYLGISIDCCDRRPARRHDSVDLARDHASGQAGRERNEVAVCGGDDPEGAFTFLVWKELDVVKRGSLRLLLETSLGCPITHDDEQEVVFVTQPRGSEKERR